MLTSLDAFQDSQNSDHGKGHSGSLHFSTIQTGTLPDLGSNFEYIAETVRPKLPRRSL